MRDGIGIATGLCCDTTTQHPFGAGLVSLDTVKGRLFVRVKDSLGERNEGFAAPEALTVWNCSWVDADSNWNCIYASVLPARSQPASFTKTSRYRKINGCSLHANQI